MKSIQFWGKFCEETCNFSTNEAFALLRKLNGRNCVETKIFLRNESASDNLEQANLFNTFFCSVYQPFSELDLNSFVFHDVVYLFEVNLSVEEIQSHLKIPDCSMAACDGVPATIYNMLKSLLPDLIYGNVHILLLSTRRVLVQTSKITGQFQSYLDFLLFLKDFFFNYIYSKLEHALNPLQHGFRSKHSTVTQLIVFLHNLRLNFDENLEQVVVYLDFAKAFDSVEHWRDLAFLNWRDLALIRVLFLFCALI